MQLLVLLLYIISLFPVSTSYTIKNLPVVENIPTATQTGDIYFQTSVSATENEKAPKEDFPLEYHYTDEYFAAPSTLYDPSLATMSLCLALSAFNSITNDTDDNIYKSKSKNVQKLFQDLGIQKEFITLNTSYTTTPKNNSIGVIVGSKNITVTEDGESKDYTLVVIGVRGGGYESEWVGNFLIGNDGYHHSGFREARDGVLSTLKEHLKTKKPDRPVKIWIAGFSRAAATTNLVGAKMDDVIAGDEESEAYKDLFEGLDVKKENVYVYSFETPAGAYISMKDKTADKYKNIFNIINPADPVPYMAPTGLKFYRYGSDLYLPCKETSASYVTLTEKMRVVYESLSSMGTHKYGIDGFHMHEVKLTQAFYKSGVMPIKRTDASSQAYFLQKFIPLVKDVLVSRQNYVGNIQSLAQDVAGKLFGSPAVRTADVTDALADEEKVSPAEMVKGFITGGGAANAVMGAFGSALEGLTHVKDIASSLIKLAPPVVSLFTKSMDDFATLYKAVSTLAEGHFPELCYAWLRIMDPQFYTNKDDVVAPSNCFAENLFRQMEISGDVEVRVYNSEGEEPIITFTRENEESVTKDECVVGVDENDNIFLLFPSSKTYNITITPVETTTDAQDTTPQSSHHSFFHRLFPFLSSSSSSSVNEDATNKEKILLNLRTYSSLHSAYVRSQSYRDLDPSTELTMEIPTVTTAEAEYTFEKETATHYNLKQGSTTITPTLDLYGEEEAAKTFSVAAISSNSKRGAVVGTGMKPAGQSILLRAEPFEGVSFVAWKTQDKKTVISTSPTLRVFVSENVTYYARFDGEEETLPEDDLDITFIIIVVVVGVLGLVIIISLIILCYCCCCRKKKEDENTQEQEDNKDVEMTETQTELPTSYPAVPSNNPLYAQQEYKDQA